MKTIFIAVVVALAVLAVAERSAQQVAPPIEQYGYTPPSQEERNLYGAENAPSLHEAAPELFEDGK